MFIDYSYVEEWNILFDLLIYCYLSRRFADLVVSFWTPLWRYLTGLWSFNRLSTALAAIWYQCRPARYQRCCIRAQLLALYHRTRRLSSGHGVHSLRAVSDCQKQHPKIHQLSFIYIYVSILQCPMQKRPAYLSPCPCRATYCSFLLLTISTWTQPQWRGYLCSPIW